MSNISLQSLLHESLRQATLLALPICLLSACVLGCTSFPGLNVLALPVMIAVPLVLTHGMARVAALGPDYIKVASLWMSGIIQFIGASLICSLLTALFLTLHPGFLSNYFHTAFDIIAEAGGAFPKGIGDPDKIIIPTPMQYVGTMFWATSFLGSITSMICGALLPHISIFKRTAGRYAGNRI